MNNDQNTLRTVRLFEGLSNKEISEIHNICIYKENKHGEVIIQKDDGEYIFIILSGHAVLFNYEENGDKYYLRDLLPGDFFWGNRHD